MLSDSGEAYLVFLEAIHLGECAFYQLDQSLFVANGWNIRKSEAVRQGWCHLQRTDIGTMSSVVCMCREFTNGDQCFHQRFLLDYGEQEFPIERNMQDVQNITILFSRTWDTLLEDSFINHFSVANSSSHNTVKNRVVVEYSGDNRGGGNWTCVKEPSANSCEHIKHPKQTLRRLFDGHLPPGDATASNEVIDVVFDRTEINTLAKSVAGVSTSVTHKPLPPPVWAQIAADGRRAAVPVVRSPPALIKLDQSAACSCRRDGSKYSNAIRIEKRSSVVYNLLEAHQITTEVQKCPVCPHGYIGPDGTDLGLFNYNNRSWFTIAILDDYTAHFTKSETPFVSWVASTACRYQTCSSAMPFVKEKLFRAAWFAYARLLQLDRDMSCSRCGPTPNVTIWDGVTLSFSQKNILPTLRPPTTVNESSESKPAIKPEATLQLIAERAVRREIVTILQGPTLQLPKASHSPDASKPTTEMTNMMQRIQMIPPVIPKLCEIDGSLADAFDKWFGFGVLFSWKPVQAPHQELFLQLAAEESAVQFINERALHNLKQFLQHPLRHHTSLLRLCPAISKVVNIDFESFGSPSKETFEVLKWIYVRSALILGRLKKYGFPEISPALSWRDDWRKTGACYGMPQVRNRPRYPGIPRENSADLGGIDLRGEGCQKFYLTYSENRKTGGLMVVWCPHSVCYGFHIIPRSEGRNDVFSAIFTRWKKAPEVVIYDFACALQPYCMLREPEFFANTLFVIDAFHAKGHTKCGRASFLTNYLETNPDLILVNSSAGESGNSGIRRIRKSVSYMSQDRAILYTRVFLSIWNRQRIRKMEGLSH
ncbi:hypothetical protein CPB83DRAFT_778174 [Crepidotus variabilis]|uniref:HMG domain-containing protein n=1 Tax=Crepidotus variabilis TaxID=179855 RepID=A0A9P6E3D1_9AGAR|nr:hypothetical protein CPB83DRAFT_778174 [Crepidotus variabilis]